MIRVEDCEFHFRYERMNHAVRKIKEPRVITTSEGINGSGGGGGGGPNGTEVGRGGGFCTP